MSDVAMGIVAELLPGWLRYALVGENALFSVRILSLNDIRTYFGTAILIGSATVPLAI